MLPSLPLDKKEVGIDLFSRSVARQVFSAPHSLTFRFGMETKWTLCDKNTNRSASGGKIRACFAWIVHSGTTVSFHLQHSILFSVVFAVNLCLSALDPRRVGIDLFSRLVAKQVFSAPYSLTFRFGMETKWTLYDKNTNCSACRRKCSCLFSFDCLTRHDNALKA